MKKEIETIRRYWIDNNWYIEAEMNRSVPESTDFWLCYRNIGIKSFLIGFNTSDITIEEIIKNNIKEYTAHFMELCPYDELEPVDTNSFN